MLALRALAAVVALPGMATVVVPWMLVHAGGTGAVPIAVRVLGGTLVVLGACTVGWCVADFARIGRGTLAPLDPPTVLVLRGLYRIVRNPMYVGVLTVLAGEALAFGSGPVALWAAALALAFHVRVVRYEEPVLRATFGAPFDEYLRSVPRWWPARPRQ